MPLLRLLLGRALATDEQAARRMGPLAGVPTLGLDALASCAYGPEAALTVLVAAGAGALTALQRVMLAIVLLLALLTVSYFQTIAAYPSEGGAYTVARENLGTRAALLAAVALMIDYVLNVAVAISAGVGAFVSAAPAAQPYTVELCLAVLLLLTLVNLRGTPEAGRTVAVPSYLFIFSFLAVIGVGLHAMWQAGGHPQPVVRPPLSPAVAAPVGTWMLLRAFASGCTAMTGVEAVSNAVGTFRPPATRNARITLLVIAATLGVLLTGITMLVRSYGILAMDQGKPGYQSVLAQVAAAAVGRGPLYWIAIGSLLAVLCLSANTSFVAFPRLCRLVARDDFLPRPFALVGRRLVYSVGIAFLAGSAGLLLLAFGGITDRLIPLFAIGAFLTFTLSQAGMVRHWWRAPRDRTAGARERAHRRPGTLLHAAVNGAGALATALALLVIVAAKFTAGAWITLLVIPAVMLLLSGVKRYYRELEARLREEGPIKLGAREAPWVLLATMGWNRLTDQALQFALRISGDVAAVHLCRLAAESPGDEQADERRLREAWSRDVEMPARAAGYPVPKLVVLPSPYRSVHLPLLRYIDRLREAAPGRQIAVLIPEVVKRRWWEHFLYTRRGRRLAAALVRYGGPDLVVVNVPWYLEAPQRAEAEEAGGTPAAPERRTGSGPAGEPAPTR